MLGFAAVTVREAHERPEGMDEGTLVMSGLRARDVLAALDVAVAQAAQFGAGRPVADYDVPQVSWKVLKIVLSYTDYINRKVWRKRG